MIKPTNGSKLDKKPAENLDTTKTQPSDYLKPLKDLVRSNKIPSTLQLGEIDDVRDYETGVEKMKKLCKIQRIKEFGHVIIRYSYLPSSSEFKDAYKTCSQYLHKIKCLELAIGDEEGNWSDAIEAEELETTIEGIKKNLTNVEHLAIHLEGLYGMNEKIMSRVGQIINESCKNLRKLSLSAVRDDFTEIEYASMEPIANMLKSLSRKTLRELKLDFSENENLSKEDLSSLNNYLSGSTYNIRSFEFIMNKFKGAPCEIIAEICKSLEDGFENLQRLSIDLSSSSDITDNVLENINQAVAKKSKTLQSLKIDLNACEGITDEGLGMLVQDFESEFTCFNDLELNFNFCTEITTEGVETLVQSISQGFPNVKNLKLYFNSCSAIEGSVLDSLSETIVEGLTELRELELNFGGCSEFNDKKVKKFEKTLKKELSELKHIEVNLKEEIREDI